MEAEIYGIIPNAKTEAFANAPPVKAFNNPPIPPASNLPFEVSDRDAQNDEEEEDISWVRVLQ